MNKKYLIAVVIILFLIVCLSICNRGNKNVKYKVTVSDCQIKNDTSNQDSLRNIKIYLETSASMKGYINRPNVEDSGYIIKEIIPYLITDITSNYSIPYLSTISISPIEYTKGEDAFIRSLNNGTIFTGGSTHIHRIFEYVLNNNFIGEISIIISDCILDIGDNDANKEIVKTAIYGLLNERENISAILIQYYSEFNGDYYYDKSGGNRPYFEKNITMHKRPLYLWVFGSSDNLEKLLAQNLFKKYENLYSYGVKSPSLVDSLNEIKLISDSKKGKVYLSDNNEFTLISPSKNDSVSFVMGIDLAKFPKFIQDVKYLSSNLILNKKHLKEKIKYNIYTKNDYEKKISDQKECNKIINQIEDFTHIIDFTLKDINSFSDTDFNITLNVSEPAWIKNAAIQDDAGKDAEELESKTYAFNTITEAFKDKFLAENNKYIFNINFKKIN